MALGLERKRLHLPTALDIGLDRFQHIQRVSALDDLKGGRRNILVLTDEGWEYYPGAQIEPYRRAILFPVPGTVSIRFSQMWQETYGEVSSRVLLRPQQRVVPSDQALAVGYDLYYEWGTGFRRQYLMD
ncbi:MAG TPA: hypothetical protein VJI15_03670 [Candidatus Nanoarchaeia archaeon]|nr:hypothetical protein [Candidatus Nanoarchaeia archaeon]